MSLFFESDVIGAKQIAFVGGVVAGLGGVGLAANQMDFGTDPEPSACNNPLLDGPYDVTIKADANLRTSPFRGLDSSENLAGQPLKREVLFSTAGIGQICLAENGQGKWYAFKDGKLSKIVDEKLEGNKQHWVWVNGQNVILAADE